MSTYRKHYAPWRRELLILVVAVFIGGWVAAQTVRMRSHSIDPWVVVAVAGFIAIRAYRSYGRRSYGKRVERIAQKRLVKAAKRAGVAVQLNVRCPSGGDIDAVVRANDLYAVEIKSWQGLRVQGGRLVKLNGHAPDKDPIAQCRREAASINAVPVLWMPQARQSRTFNHAGVLIVMGDARRLLSSL